MQTDSLNLPNNTPSLYLRLNNLHKKYAKVVVLFFPLIKQA